MESVVYENSFDANEWFVIAGLVSIGIVYILPRTFNRLEAFAYFLYGVFVNTFYDHTISVKPWDFYDVNDRSDYQVFDFLSYLIFGSYSYVFMYLYVKLRVRGFGNIVYLCAWTIVAMLLGWIAIQVGLYHYDKGYRMYWSFPIYLFAQSGLIFLHHMIRRKKRTIDA